MTTSPVRGAPESGAAAAGRRTGAALARPRSGGLAAGICLTSSYTTPGPMLELLALGLAATDAPPAGIFRPYRNASLGVRNFLR